jgi:hypothetical protein
MVCKGRKSEIVPTNIDGNIAPRVERAAIGPDILRDETLKVGPGMKSLKDFGRVAHGSLALAA